MDTSFTVLPISQGFSLEPGQTYTGKITIVNPADSSNNFSYQVSVAPYSVTGTNYEADLATEKDRSMIKDWIKISETTGEVAPNETKDVAFTITVPESAPAGGQYAAILVTENLAKSNDSSAVNSVFEIASLVYADVAGETVVQGEVLENNIPAFVMNTPVTIGSLVSNTGNIHKTITTLVTVKNLISGKQIVPSDSNPGRYGEIVLPETTRKTEYPIENLPAVGIVEISQTVIYEDEPSVKTQTVFICPVWFMVLSLIVISAVILSIIFAIKKHKKKVL